jgi:hypothetical protein
MSLPVLVKAARTFLQQDAKRRSRPLLTPAEKGRLSLELNAIEGGGVPSDAIMSRVRRGDLAASIAGYNDTFDEVAANVIADILHAAEARGQNPLQIVARARSYYFQEAPKEAIS